ncbi:MAG TPA: flavin reductase family protein [Alphaproteobacteria bacterium]
MQFSAKELTPAQRYKLLVGLVVPRPIAWITTLGPSGTVNAAPFSFFNVVSDDPVLVIVSINRRANGSLKDTLVNIDRSGEWVVNIADEKLGEAMHKTSGDFPPDVSEAEVVGLALAPSVDVAAPRIQGAPFSLECRTWKVLEIGPERRLLMGEGLRLHVRDDVIDPATLRLREDAFFPVGRLYGDRYVRTRDRYTLPPAKGR